MKLRKLKDELKKYTFFLECIPKRYNLKSCLMLINVEDAEDVEKILQKSIRCADKVIVFEPGLYGILFFYDNIDGYSVFTNKVMFILEKYFPRSKISIGVACQCDEECGDIVTKALQNLLEAKESLQNTIIE